MTTRHGDGAAVRQGPRRIPVYGMRLTMPGGYNLTVAAQPKGRRKSSPSYRRQRRGDGSELAFVEIDGKRHYLGAYDTPESRGNTIVSSPTGKPMAACSSRRSRTCPSLSWPRST